MANRIIESDAERGVKEAILLKGKVTRKVVKQTVRFIPYLISSSMSC